MTFDVLGDLNYLAAAAAAVAYFVVGSIWYAPPLLGKMWQRAARLTEEQARSGPTVSLFVGTFVAYFLQAVALALIAAHTATDTLGEGVILGLVVGLVVAASIWVNNAYQRQTGTLFWINGTNAIVGFIVMAIIVALWN